ncbi:hypothetical protein [Paenibacillus macerans]|uniref:hypothetical protein n=1 Tax=Paenibacillus macerans TaxID=44252 RepID=UPI00203E5976|nr:hypothetical protein [Paenibacillus macerans]MCM3700662.1 hypothetical protein [Paenibacillus macerans]
MSSLNNVWPGAVGPANIGPNIAPVNVAPVNVAPVHHGFPGFWTSTGTILVLYILLVIILHSTFI